MLALRFHAGAPPISFAANSVDVAKPSDSFDAEERQYCAWVRDIAAGDQQAFSALYDALVSKVYGLALRLTGNTALAEDVVADTFTQAWRQADRYEVSRGKVSTWLLTICRSRALDALRREQDADDIDDHELADARIGPDALLEYANTSAVLQAALQRLEPAQRQLLALAYFRDMSHSELADYTALPLGTVKTLIRKGLIELRRVLGSSFAQQVDS
jgi:RNA polymerase sigma factor (sigma-70 family)